MLDYLLSGKKIKNQFMIGEACVFMKDGDIIHRGAVGDEYTLSNDLLEKWAIDNPEYYEWTLCKEEKKEDSEYTKGYKDAITELEVFLEVQKEMIDKYESKQ